MIISSLEGGGDRAVLVDNFKHQADLKLYSQFPDYDDFQCYDLGVGGILSRISRKIYANFHKPSWGTSNRHLLMAKIPKKLFRELKKHSRKR